MCQHDSRPCGAFKCEEVLTSLQFGSVPNIYIMLCHARADLCCLRVKAEAHCGHLQAAVTWVWFWNPLSTLAQIWQSQMDCS